MSEELPIEEFELMGGIEDPEDDQTEPPEPHLVRAQSLRVEQ